MLYSNILKTFTERKIYIEMYYFYTYYPQEDLMEIHRAFDNREDAEMYKEQVGESYNFSIAQVPISFLVGEDS